MRRVDYSVVFSRLRAAALRENLSFAIDYDELQCVWRGYLRRGKKAVQAIGLSRFEVCERLLEALRAAGAA